MLGSVLKLWHDARSFASDNPSLAKLPDAHELKEASLHTNINLLEIDDENNTVRISDPNARIDVGALGKGYATEKAAQLLESMNCYSYVLNIGGNIHICGRSIGTVNVQKILERLNGGGHFDAAGVQTSIGSEATLTKLQKAIDDYEAEVLAAREGAAHQ